VTAGASGNSATASSGSATTTSANELIFGANTVYTSVNAAGSGFTSRIITPYGDIAEDETVTTTGSYGASSPLTSSGPWVMQMVTFTAASSSAPTVTGVSPNSGPAKGGTQVTITGTNFASGATVTFGGTAATNVVVASSTSITATAPAHAAGAVTVTVTENGQSANLVNGFSYTATISFVQVGNTTTPSAQTVTVAYPGSQTAGDLNIIVVGWNDTSATVQSVKDSAGNTYTLAIGPTSGTALRQSIYYASNIVSGSNTVTVTFNQAAVYPDIRVLEYSGVSKLDVTAGGSGNSSTASSGSATTTSANELIFGANMVYTWVSAAGSGFTARVITTYGDIAEDKTVTTTGSYTASATLGSSGPWVMQMVTFH
jgi:IPT/TIG domain